MIVFLPEKNKYPISLKCTSIWMESGAFSPYCSPSTFVSAKTRSDLNHCMRVAINYLKDFDGEFFFSGKRILVFTLTSQFLFQGIHPGYFYSLIYMLQRAWWWLRASGWKILNNRKFAGRWQTRSGSELCCNRSSLSSVIPFLLNDVYIKRVSCGNPPCIFSVKLNLFLFLLSCRLSSLSSACW